MYTISAIGQDSHRFTYESKPLILGGIRFENCRGLEANSDGDVILHALTNAVSGLTGINILGRIADEMCAGGIKNSEEYLKKALTDMLPKGLRIVHISVSVECSEPKISPYIQQIKENIGRICMLHPTYIGLTATTGEGLTAFGRGEGIAATAIITALCSFERNAY